MDAAASEGARVKCMMNDAGVQVFREPFVAVNLKDFEPKWCKQEFEDPESEDDGIQGSGFKALAHVFGA